MLKGKTYYTIIKKNDKGCPFDVQFIFFILNHQKLFSHPLGDTKKYTPLSSPFDCNSIKTFIRIFSYFQELLQRLTSEMTAYPFLAGRPGPPLSPQLQPALSPQQLVGSLLPPQLTLYSCEHCGKEFTSKRKHQRHVLNVHFG